MKVTESKQKVFFLILGLFGIILTGNLLFGIKSVSYTQASLSDYSYYNKYSTLDSLKYLPTTFSNVYNPKDKVSLSFTIKKLESHQKFFKKPVSVSLDTKAFYAKTKHKKLLTILCKKEYNSEHKIMTQKEREKKFISTVLPYIVYFNTQVLKQRSNLLNILKNNLSDIKLSAYKNYMISRFSKKETPYVKDRYIQKSKFQRSKIKSLSSLNKSSLIDNSYSDKDLDFSIFKKLTNKEKKYLAKVNLKKYHLNKTQQTYIKRLAYKNSLTRSAYTNNTDLLLTMLIASVDTIPVSLFLAQAKEESNMAQSKAAYTLNNLFGTQIPPNKKFNSETMGRVCASGTVRLRKFNSLYNTFKFQLDVFNVNKPMLLIKNNRFLLRLKNKKNITGQSILDEMPGYAEKGGYLNRLKHALKKFVNSKGTEIINYRDI